ncbi:hypothetical protein AAF712_010154 [Marasmius tenuissimus]|uniref:F-box domain-containing protein n=1 Tax=Marasmius tenuissimus TaxID=585030 RepID=A0ABR2ZNE0_9AGAR
MSNALLPKSLPNEIIKNILHFIYQDLARQSKVLPLSFALVAKNWFMIWVSLRWKNVNIGQLFYAITVGGKYLESRPTEAQWIRFEAVYARWVERFRVEAVGKFLNLQAVRRLFNLLIRRYPSTANITNITGKRIFPNLRSIDVVGLSVVATRDMVGYLARIVYMASHAGVTSFSLSDHDSVLEKAGITLHYTYQGFAAFPLIEGDHVVIPVRDFEVRGPQRFREWLEILGAAFLRTSAEYIFLPPTRELFRKVRKEGCKSNRFQLTCAVSQPGPTCLPALVHPYHRLRYINLRVEVAVAMELFNVVRSKVTGTSGSPYLKKVKLELVGSPECSANFRAARVLHRLFKAIAGIAPLTLEDVIVWIPPSNPEGPFLDPTNVLAQENAINYDVLQPLRGCPRLKSLDIRDIYPLVINNEELVTLARSWPGLIHLHLGLSSPLAVTSWHERGLKWLGPTQIQPVKGIDLGALEALGRACKWLRRTIIMMKEDGPAKKIKGSLELEKRMNMLFVPVLGTGFSWVLGYPKDVMQETAIGWMHETW